MALTHIIELFRKGLSREGIWHQSDEEKVFRKEAISMWSYWRTNFYLNETVQCSNWYHCRFL